LTFLVLLLPAALYIASNGHRMYQFTILVILYTAVISMDIYEQRERSAAEYAKIALLGAFISVFRSEGIIIGALFFGIYLLFGAKRSLKNTIIRVAVFAALFFVLSFPGKVGEKKYYGKDYSMINTFDVIRNILNDESCNTSYNGAADDLAAIEAVSPIAIIQSGGTDGYRRFNYNIKGHKDINQSGEDAKAGEAFMKAYRHLVFHNLGLYARSQLNSVMVAIGVGPVFEMSEYKGEGYSLDNWYYCGWDNGIDDFYAGSFTDGWFKNEFRKGIADSVMNLRDRIYSFLKNRKLYVTGVALMLIMCAVLLIRGVAAFFKKKDAVKLAVGFMFLTGALSFLAVCVVMPTSATIYFIGSLYCLLTLILVFFCNEFKGFGRRPKA
ncbi:MAG: hypothetical protein IKZ39_01365, partial [Lachnospiraceae bacterium]|nr:hypothetical protein [Lachnospiraceae bacterium]